MIITASKENSLLVVLNKEEKLVSALTQIALKENIQGGCIMGIGALKEVELGYYDLENKTYLRKTFSSEDFELIALNGNISTKEKKPFIHVHAILGKSDFSTFGGHLFEGTVAVTAEITIVPLGKMPNREMNEAIGISLICGHLG